MLGWCDMSQWKLALRGKSESQVHKDIKMFRKDGVVQGRAWTDEDWNPPLDVQDHAGDDCRKHKRPSQKKGVVHPPRYKSKKAPSRGWFSSENQPIKKVMAAVAGMDEDE